MHFDPDTLLGKIATATDQLLTTAAAFDDADVRQPSLLPGWSRGHVLTHVARNADGGTRMLTWARTGIENPEYPSMAARAEQIEAGHRRAARDLFIDVRDSAARFAAAYELMPDQAWTRILRWTSGKERPACRAADSRLTEVLIHHVDLRAGFGPEDWPGDFVDTTLATVIATFGARHQISGLRLAALDTGAEYRLGTQHAPNVVRGPRASLLVWLLGRSDGADLDGSLPTVPFLY